MAGALVQARIAAEGIIAATVPVDWPRARWDLAPPHLRIEEMPLALSPVDNTRQFQVRCVPTYTPAADNVFVGLAVSALEVVVLYQVPIGRDTGGAVRVADLTSSDCVQLGVALRRATWPAGIASVELDGQPTVSRRGDEDDVWLMRFELRVILEVAASG